LRGEGEHAGFAMSTQKLVALEPTYDMLRAAERESVECKFDGNEHRPPCTHEAPPDHDELRRIWKAMFAAAPALLIAVAALCTPAHASTLTVILPDQTCRADGVRVDYLTVSFVGMVCPADSIFKNSFEVK
jgi:hypothetical protein